MHNTVTHNTATLAPQSRIAVIGAGISGLAAAWLLARRYGVALFEANDYFGGHTHTVNVQLEGFNHPVDTGFLVHNDITYPNLVQLLAHLGAPVHPSDMSFAVSVAEPDLEWAGTSLSTVFAQRRNLLRPEFLGMLRDILRFNGQAPRHRDEARREGLTLAALLARHHYGQPMRDWYLLPMAAAIWSSSVKDILEFPAATFLDFCLNHRLLQVNDRPQWKTLLHGGRDYVQRMLATIPDARSQCPVYGVRRGEDGVIVTSNRGDERFDAVVFATHAPTTLALLDADEAERAVLAGVRYQPNAAVLHTDRALLPRREAVWSAWNYLCVPGADGSRPTAVSYLINQLQPLPFKTPVVVTLNPPFQPDESLVLGRYDYEHPVMDAAAMRAQEALPGIQGQNRAWFCGAWTGYGFHEDGLKSALRVAAALGVSPPWEAVL